MTTLILDWAAAWDSGPVPVGGKGWQLGALAEMGAPVPPGFVISADAGGDRQAGDSLTADLVTAVSQELERRGWCDRALAVRSSACGEDSVRASFAGIYRSRLNVRGVEGTLRAVQEVLDSLWTPAAAAYRQRLGISNQDTAMAVIVMPLLPAVTSGIAFTCDPISGREDQIIIHAHWGLGEALVGGDAEGDEYRLQTNRVDDSLTVIDQRQGSKARMTTVCARGGTELCNTPAHLVSRAGLSAEQAIALGRLVQDAATALDYANPRYDVEWVWDGENFWIVQARPITARGRYTYPALSNQPTLWSRGNSRDVAPDPLSPLDWSLSLLDRMLTQSSKMAGYETLPGVQRSALRHGRLYFDLSVIQWEAFDGFAVPPHSLNKMMGGHQPTILVPEATLVERFTRVRRSLRYVRRCVKPRRRARATLHRARRDAAEWLARPIPADNNALAQYLRELITVIRRADDLFFLQASSGSAHLVLLDLLEKYCPGEGPSLTAGLLAGGEPSVTAAQGYELMELGRIAAGDPAALAWLRGPDRIGAEWLRQLAEDSPFRRAFADFIQRYGHRGIYESYLRNARWREVPDYLLDSVVGLIGRDPAELRARQRMISLPARRRVSKALPFWYRPLIPVLIKFATIERNLREAARSALMAYLEVARGGALALGKHFAGSLGLERPEDIFNLTLPEALALAEGYLPIAAAAKRAAWRGRQLQDAASQVGPEVVMEHGGATPPTALAAIGDGEAQNDVWRGTVVGSGHAQGIACIARHPTEAMSMETGAILVTPSTDPSWTPLFLRAGALVMETGGYLSHGAIVAREFGIPAVVNVPGILDRITNGDILEVDGSRAIVRRL